MTPTDKAQAAPPSLEELLRASRRYYLREARKLHTRRDAIVAIQRNNVGDLTSELSQEKREIEDQMYRAGMELWEAFQEWAASLGWQPVKYEDVRKVIDGRK